jgi:phthiodiolone/phenolphthiodiolone dimycocerosates ketoreductase
MARFGVGIEELFAVGTPDEVVDQIRELRQHGLRYLVLGNAGAIRQGCAPLKKL